MQSTGQTSTHELSLTPMHGSAITYAIGFGFLSFGGTDPRLLRLRGAGYAAVMLLLTGATGLVGSALRRRLIAAEQPIRCLVRDPRGLGDDRVRVQIALGD